MARSLWVQVRNTNKRWVRQRFPLGETDIGKGASKQGRDRWRVGSYRNLLVRAE